MTPNPSVEEAIECGVCGLPIHPMESGVRHFGFYTAHSEQRCVSLLRGRLEDAFSELEAVKGENALLKASVAKERPA